MWLLTTRFKPLLCHRQLGDSNEKIGGVARHASCTVVIREKRCNYFVINRKWRVVIVACPPTCSYGKNMPLQFDGAFRCHNFFSPSAVCVFGVVWPGNHLYRGPTVGAKCSCKDFRGMQSVELILAFLCLL
jgi:hypothetical protein